MLNINSTYTLPVSDANLAIIPIVAKVLGYDPALADTTPEEHIIKHFDTFYDDLEAKVERGLTEHFGKSAQGLAVTESIMTLYRNEVIRTTTISEPTEVEE